MSSSSAKTYCIPLHDRRKDVQHKIKHAPTVHIARGYEGNLEFLKHGRAFVCISDWQYETATQEHFWEQAEAILRAELGEEILESAIILVAGDMASCDNLLRGGQSDDVPRLEWLRKSVPNGDVLMIYGNHDLLAQEHLNMFNERSGAPCYAPHGESMTFAFDRERGTVTDRSEWENDGPGAIGQAKCDFVRDSLSSSQLQVAIQPGMTKEERAALYTKVTFKKLPKKSKLERQNEQWSKQHPEQARLSEEMKRVHVAHAQAMSRAETENSMRIGCVHGIPASHTEGFRKIERAAYFQALQQVCTGSIDILVTHSNPCLPGQERRIKGDDARRLYDQFLQSTAQLHVHGHMHTDPVVSILKCGKVVVNSDCRVVAFVPG